MAAAELRHILITGGRGQLGLELTAAAWPTNVVLHAPSRAELDLEVPGAVEAAFATTPFAAVINAAAYTAVDRAEAEVAKAFSANAQGPALLADATRDRGIPLLHVSTDYVFDGLADRPYTEDDAVQPINVYGASKLAGELAVLKGNPRSAVVRTAWVLSSHRQNFLRTMLRLATTRPELGVVDDQRGCPTSAADLAEALRTVALRMIDDRDAPTGLYHFVNGGETSWAGLARHIFAESGRAGGPATAVRPVTTTEYPTPAKRPRNSRLSTARITRDFGVQPRQWEDAVSKIVAELREKGFSQ
ncbi:MAG: dTDP-4-dehydrorhamnose reductase [Brevundimonas sp.]